MWMSLVIEPENGDRWLSPISKDEIKAMMIPLAEGILVGYPVSKLVYAKWVNANVPELIERVEYQLINTSGNATQNCYPVVTLQNEKRLQ